MSQVTPYIFVHFLIFVYKQQPLLSPNLHFVFEDSLRDIAHQLNAALLAVNSSQDHVHFVVSLPSTVSVAHFIKAAKSSTSHAINKRAPFNCYFRWQAGYTIDGIERRNINCTINQFESDASDVANCPLYIRMRTLGVESVSG